MVDGLLLLICFWWDWLIWICVLSRMTFGCLSAVVVFCALQVLTLMGWFGCFVMRWDFVFKDEFKYLFGVTGGSDGLGFGGRWVCWWALRLWMCIMMLCKRFTLVYF